MKFKNVSNKDLSIPGIGLIRSGQVRNMPKDFHNANFEKVEEKVSEDPKHNKHKKSI